MHEGSNVLRRPETERTVGVLKWMFLRLRDVDTSLCFTTAAAAAAAALTTDDCVLETSVIVTDDNGRKIATVATASSSSLESPATVFMTFDNRASVPVYYRAHSHAHRRAV